MGRLCVCVRMQRMIVFAFIFYHRTRISKTAHLLCVPVARVINEIRVVLLCDVIGDVDDEQSLFCL